MTASNIRCAVASIATALTVVLAVPLPAVGADLDPTCTEEQRAGVPPPFDPATCRRVAGADPELVDGLLFVWHELEGGGVSEVIGVDAATGEQVWSSTPIEGEVQGIEPASVDGQPGIAALALQTTEGDAVTEAAQSWVYLEWPIAEKRDSTSPATTIRTPATFSSSPVWAGDHVAVDDQILRPDSDAFEPFARGDDVVIGQYDMAEQFVGFTGAVSVNFVEDLAWTEDGSEDGDSYAGWVVRNLDGTVVWQELSPTPNPNTNTISYSGPMNLPIVVGGRLLAITGDTEGFASPMVTWLDPATGEPATPPTPSDLAGQAIRAMDNHSAWMSPSGSYIYAHSTMDGYGVVVDIDVGTVKPVDTDFMVSATAIDDTTAYGTTSGGNATVDLATATAAALPEGTDPPIAADSTLGVFGDPSGSELAVVSR